MSAAVESLLLLLLAALLVWAGVADWRRYVIPNRISLAVALLAPAHWLAGGGAAWPWALAAGAGLFALGTLLFARGILGGGDVKLLAALALWPPPGELVGLLFVIALAGALLAAATATYLRFLRPWPAGDLAPDAASAQRLRASVPYALAIAAGGLWYVVRAMS